MVSRISYLLESTMLTTIPRATKKNLDALEGLQKEFLRKRLLDAFERPTIATKLKEYMIDQEDFTEFVIDLMANDRSRDDS